MIHRITFEPSDFESSGQMIIRNNYRENGTDIGFAVTVAYKICYHPKSGGNEIFQIALSDGMVFKFDSLEAFCEELNSDDCGYRPMTKVEMHMINEYQGNRFSDTVCNY